MDDRPKLKISEMRRTFDEIFELEKAPSYGMYRALEIRLMDRSRRSLIAANDAQAESPKIAFSAQRACSGLMKRVMSRELAGGATSDKSCRL